MGCCVSSLRSPDCLYTDLTLQYWDKVKARFDETEEYGPFDFNQIFPLTMELEPPVRLNRNGDTVLTMVMHYIYPLNFCNQEFVGEGKFYGRKQIDFEHEPIEFTKIIFEAQSKYCEPGDDRNIAAEKSQVTGCFPLHYAFKLVDLELVQAIREAYPEALSVKCERDPLDEYDELNFEDVPPAQVTPYELALFYGHRYQEGMGAVETLLELLDYPDNPHTDDEGAPLVKPRVYETWQCLIDNKAYDEVKKWLGYTGIAEDEFTYHFVSSNMEKCEASEARMDEIHHVDIQGRTPLHACFRPGMTEEDVEVANLILDISDSDDRVGYRDGGMNICHFKDKRELYPISLAAMYCQDSDLIQRIKDKNPHAVEESTGRSFPMTPYEYMKDHFGDSERSEWDNDKKLAMLEILDFEFNNSR